jgi:hypothetical protein
MGLMNRRILCVALFLTPLVACGGVSPDDPSLVAGDYFPVKFTFGEDECGLKDAISALTDAKYTFGRKMLSEDRDSGDFRSDGLEDAIEAGATDLWNICREFPEIDCDTSPTLVHFERWKEAAIAGSGCTEAAILGNDGERSKFKGWTNGLFLNEKELILKEDFRIECGNTVNASDDTASPDEDYTYCETSFSMRLKR